MKGGSSFEKYIYTLKLNPINDTKNISHNSPLLRPHGRAIIYPIKGEKL
jgi:hypothetical protein